MVGSHGKDDPEEPDPILIILVTAFVVAAFLVVWTVALGGV